MARYRGIAYVAFDPVDNKPFLETLRSTSDEVSKVLLDQLKARIPKDRELTENQKRKFVEFYTTMRISRVMVQELP
jgi:hypothetical protein